MRAAAAEQAGRARPGRGPARQGADQRAIDLCHHRGAGRRGGRRDRGRQPGQGAQGPGPLNPPAPARTGSGPGPLPQHVHEPSAPHRQRPGANGGRRSPRSSRIRVSALPGCRARSRARHAAHCASPGWSRRCCRTMLSVRSSSAMLGSLADDTPGSRGFAAGLDRWRPGATPWVRAYPGECRPDGVPPAVPAQPLRHAR